MVALRGLLVTHPNKALNHLQAADWMRSDDAGDVPTDRAGTSERAIYQERGSGTGIVLVRSTV
jgi:hypothetical protein